MANKNRRSVKRREATVEKEDSKPALVGENDTPEAHVVEEDFGVIVEDYREADFGAAKQAIGNNDPVGKPMIEKSKEDDYAPSPVLSTSENSSPLSSGWGGWFGALKSSAIAQVDRLYDALENNGSKMPVARSSPTEAVANQAALNSPKDSVRAIFEKDAEKSEPRSNALRHLKEQIATATTPDAFGPGERSAQMSPVISSDNCETYPVYDESFDESFRRFGGYSALEKLQIMSSDAAKRLKRQIKQSGSSALVSELASIDALFDSETLMENASSIDESIKTRPIILDCEPAIKAMREYACPLDPVKRLVERRCQLAKSSACFCRSLASIDFAAEKASNISSAVSFFIAELLHFVNLCEDDSVNETDDDLRSCTQRAIEVISDASYSVVPCLKLQHVLDSASDDRSKEGNKATL